MGFMKVSGWAHLMALLLVLTPGCATPYLWTDSKLASVREPAPGHALELYQAPAKRDLLAVYDELQVNGTTRRRAYFIAENEARTERSRRPKFVNPRMAEGSEAIAVLAPGETDTNKLVYAVRVANRRFELYAAGAEQGTYNLPVYHDATSTTKQVLLTPLAVTLDVTGIGAVAAVVSAALYSKSWPRVGDAAR